MSTFNPHPNVVENCSALLDQCADVIVVDDGSTSADEDVYAELEARGCTILRLQQNSGIAAALNRGVSLARSRNQALGYILTMDQDSLVQPGFVKGLEEAASAAAEAGLRVGMVAPGKVSGLPSRAVKTHNGVTIGDEPVQSGLLIPISCIDAVGPFNEELFIDGVDSEFYLRAKARNLHCIIAPDCALNHSLGAMVPASFGPWPITWRGRPLMVRTAATWRYYFIFRNRILLAAKFARKEPYWTLRGLLTDLRHLTIVSLLAPGRRERLIAVGKGLTDGLRRQSGPGPAR
ncbi:glycosyltransferase [Pseudarthrobacter sp. NPDC058196]|uniref:glycosyltransferase n=1 Tax=Pseudarthrobacter sp. NPDC058196 TaxID=3346376 RepID=UPI0036DF2ABF